MSAILIEDLGKCFEFPARWCSQRTHRGQTVAGRRTGLSVLTQRLSPRQRYRQAESRLRQCSGLTPEGVALFCEDQDRGDGVVV